MKTLAIYSSIFLAAVLGFILTACTENEPKKETTVMKNEECLICGAPLEYLEQDTLMECVLCHKKEPSKTRCVEGHYVCSNIKDILSIIHLIYFLKYTILII